MKYLFKKVLLKGLQFQSDCGIIAFAAKENGIKTKYRGVEQLVARRAHNPKVVGSSPSPATRSVTVVDTISATVIFYLLPFLECFWHEIGDTPNIFDHKQIVCPDLMRPWSEKTGLGKITIVIRI